MSTRSDIEKELLLDWDIDLREISRALAKYELHIVTSADKKVLDACSSLEDGPVKSGTLISFWPAMADVCKAELARRNSPKG